MANSTEVAGLDWSGDRLIPAFQAPAHVDVYDIRSASPDVQLTVATMAGLINRPKPQVYLIGSDDDAFWLTQLPATIQKDSPPVTGEGVLESLLISYRSSTQGMIVYDPNLPDSINVATMLASQENGIVVSPMQVQDLQGAYHLPILADLQTHHWSSRLQAYQWALQHLRSLCTSRFVAGLDPRLSAGLRSFLVATRTFIYYLDSRGYLPDVPYSLRSERGLMQDILRSFAPGTVHLGWFVDEPSGVSLTSRAALAVLATDLASNLELWTAVQPLRPLPPQPPQPQPRQPASKVYVSFTVSDGDNLQYNQHRMLRLWRDPARGSVPVGWTISPLLHQVAPCMAAYYAETATTNDEFIAGPNGAGYMYPSHWPAEHLPAFLQRTEQLMQNMRLSLLEVLDVGLLQSSGLPLISGLEGSRMALTDEGLLKSFIQALMPNGLRGIISGAGTHSPSWSLINGCPVYQNLGLADSISGALQLITNAASAQRQRPLFLNVYLLAWKMTLSDIKQVVQQLGSDYEVVTPGSLLAMLAKEGHG